MNSTQRTEYNRRYYHKNREALCERQRRYAKANRKRIREYRRKYRLENPGIIIAARKRGAESARKARWRGYGMNDLQAEQLLNAHGGKCDCCGADAPGGRGTWHVDHDHITKHIRGVICASCNLALGKIERVGLDSFHRYLTKGVK